MQSKKVRLHFFVISQLGAFVLFFIYRAYINANAVLRGRRTVANEKVPMWRHMVTLIDREELNVNGVVSLGSYDEKEVAMETEMGILMIRGDGLKVKQLNLEDGKISLEGTVQGIYYEDHPKERRGLLNRLLK